MVDWQPGAASGSASELGQPTLHEFLARLASSPDARAAFDADPRAALDQAGLEEMTAADVLQASSLVLDYAPIEVVEEYDRSLQSSVEKFAASNQFAAFNQLHPVHPHDQEVTEQSMLHSTPEPAPDFSNGGDVDPQMPAPAPAPAPSEPAPSEPGNVDIDSEVNDSGNLVSVHDVASGNTVAGVGNAVGNVTDSVVGDTVGEVTDTVEHTVDTGAEFGAGAGAELNDTVNSTLDAGGDLVGGVSGAAGAPMDAAAGGSDLPVVGDAVGGVTDVAGQVAEGPVEGVGEVAGQVTEGPLEGVTGALPVDDLPL